MGLGRRQGFEIDLAYGRYPTMWLEPRAHVLPALVLAREQEWTPHLQLTAPLRVDRLLQTEATHRPQDCIDVAMVPRLNLVESVGGGD